MATRTQWQVQIAVAKPGTTGATRIQSAVLRGAASVTWKPGALLTLNSSGRLVPLTGKIDATVSSPVMYIALSEYKGDQSYVTVQGIGPDTVFVGQMKTGSATAADIGALGVLEQNTSTGVWAVAKANEKQSIEIVDVEPNWQPGEPRARANYNLVWFRFLPQVINRVVVVPEGGGE